MPSETVNFPSVDEALVIHTRLLEVFGGTSGLRDAGLLESALFRPQTGYYSDLAEMATALFESLVINHPFIDGNKRVAFFVADVFLRFNGWKMAVEPEPANRFLIRLLDEGRCDFEHLLPWVRDSLVPLE